MKKNRGAVETATEQRSFNYGWVVVGAAIVLLAGLNGSSLSFGVFVIPLGGEFGWTRAATSGALSLSVGIAGLTGALMGRLMDRHGIRLVLAIGTVIGVAAHLLLSTVDAMWQFYLFYGLGVGMSAGASYSPANATVSKWFSGDKRVLAIGLALTGMVIGQSAVAPIAAWIIDKEGWRTAYTTLAIIVAAGGLVGIALMGRKPPASSAAGTGETIPAAEGRSDGGRDYSVKEAVRTAPFWMLVVTGVTMALSFYMLIGHIVPCAEDLGMSGLAASRILTVSGVGSWVGTVAAYFLAARLGANRAFMVLLCGQAVTTFLFLRTQSVWSFYSVGAVFGFCYGAAIPIRMAVIVPLFGPRCVGALLGLAGLAFQVGGVAGPYLIGYIRDATGFYDWAFYMTGVLLVVGAMSVYLWGEHKEQGKPIPPRASG